MSSPLGITKQQMLQRVRQALGRDVPLSQPPAAPVVDDALMRLTERDADLLTLFKANATSVGMFVEPCTGATLVTVLIGALADAEARSVTLAVDGLPWSRDIEAALTAAGVSIREWRGDREMTAHFEVDAGITDVQAALAETGTIICCTGPDHARGHTLAVPVHIAIVRRTDILADMLDYMAKLEGTAPADLPSAQTFITGPSKTADIEGVLITGVHGPGKVVILVVEDA